MATEQLRVGDKIMTPIGNIELPATILAVEPFSTDAGQGRLVTYDIDGMGVYEVFHLDSSDHADYRMERSRMPYRDDAKCFHWNLYGQQIETQKRIANAFIINWPQFYSDGQGLYICSEVNGSGKTYLACCLATEVVKKYSIPLKFVTANDYIAMIRDKDTDAEAIKDCSLLIFDDIGAQSEKQEWISESIFRLVDYRYRNKRPTIYTSNLPIKQASRNDRTFSRIYERSFEIKLPEVSIREQKADARKEQFLQRLLAS